MASPRKRSDDRGVYIISVAAELAGVHPQTLRIYERKGLLRPARTAGNTRRYSDRDIQRLRTIQRLTGRGVNLAGVKMVIQLQAELERLRQQMDEMEEEAERAHRRLREETERIRRRYRGDLVPLSSIRPLPWEGSAGTSDAGPLAR
ncbi:MAG TPA: helix-turn-helix transcriptional regulator [Actinomycetota bacterium]|nr:helix-turn-helix transcriptional regulator [Actinomycetota bacterium]